MEKVEALLFPIAPFSSLLLSFFNIFSAFQRYLYTIPGNFYFLIFLLSICPVSVQTVQIA